MGKPVRGKKNGQGGGKDKTADTWKPAKGCHPKVKKTFYRATGVLKSNDSKSWGPLNCEGKRGKELLRIRRGGKKTKKTDLWFESFAGKKIQGSWKEHSLRDSTTKT